LDSKALTKIQSVALIAVVLVAAVGGGAAYILWSGTAQSTETIKVGLTCDLDYYGGAEALHAAELAAEQVNAEGGVLGRNFTIVAEDDDGTTNDISVAINAMTKLITVDKADYVMTLGGAATFSYQDLCSEQKKILVSVYTSSDELSQRVLDNYDKYKYYFSMMANGTSSHDGFVDSLLVLRNYTGFNKVAYIDQDVGYEKWRSSVLGSLSEYGFDVVYQGSATWATGDFTSYFAAMEAAGAEILFANIYLSACTPFVKEWHDRQSPFVLWGMIDLATAGYFWDLTEGECEYVSSCGFPSLAGYPLTNQTIPFRDAYNQRWNGELPTIPGTLIYDFVRFVLPDAIKRAGTTETEAVIKALEKTDVETTTARRFLFTSSHDVFIGMAGPNRPDVDYMLVCLFQWQNGTQVPVYPQEIMDEAGATYKYPPWQGPWSK